MDTQHFKELLESERTQLREELEKIATEVDSAKGVWEPIASTLDVDRADLNEVADAAEESGEQVVIVGELGLRYQNIVLALKKIEEGTYGVCEISGEKIEEDRLEANPAARTCKAHMEKERELE